jgi:hypothetical protein
MISMTTRKEKIRKLRALAQSPNKHEAAQALEKAQALESTIVSAPGKKSSIKIILGPSMRFSDKYMRDVCAAHDVLRQGNRYPPSNFALRTATHIRR